MGTTGSRFSMISDITKCAYCVPCAHYRFLYQNGKKDAPKVCLYILDTGHSRGCQAGVGCNKRKTPKELAASKQGVTQFEQFSHISADGKKTRTVWDGETDAQLLRLRAGGMPLKQIAARLGKTESAVASRVSTLRKRGVL